jgi:class 3 adenylate cyclase
MSDPDRAPERSDLSPAEQPVKRRLAAILAMDAFGYSRLTVEDEEGTIATLRAHRVVIDGIIASHEGRIVGTAGDSVLAEFASPVEAVRSAVEIQDALKTRNDGIPEDKRLLFRIGINLGDVMVEGESEDLLGDGVNIAARLEGCAEPGGIVVSSSIYDQIADKLSLGFTDMGEQALKNIPRPGRAFSISGVAPPTSPSPTKRGLSRRVLAGIVAAVLVATAAGAYLGGVLDGPRQGGSTPTATAPADGDAALWARVRNSGDPADLQAYLAKYPRGSFAAAARARLAGLGAEADKAQQSRDKTDEGRK